MNQLRAIIGAFQQQWKTTVTSIVSLTFLIEALPVVAVLAWIAAQNNDPSVLPYILVGAPLMATWNGVVFRVGWSLTSELNERTLEFAIVSRTPIITILFGKTLAQIVYGIPSGLFALLVMFLVTRQIPEVASVSLLLASLLFVVMSLAIISLLLSPLIVLIGGRAGSFNAIIPFGAVLSGFLFPIDRLPIALEVIARFLPMSWAMEGVWYSIKGAGSLWFIAIPWAMCLIASVGLYGLTYMMFRVIEKRIRVNATLGTY